VSSRVTIVGPVFPYRAGIAYCTTRLAEELSKSAQVSVLSFKRQYPKRFYPGKDDIDETLRQRTPSAARFALDITNPLTWLGSAWRLRRSRPDAVVFVWWIWVWALPYLLMIALLPRRTQVILQAHNISDKEPAWWKSLLTNRVLRRANAIVVHADSERVEAEKRAPGKRMIKSHLPVHELGGPIPTRHDAKTRLDVHGRNVALFFGHVRPFKGLDIALRGWTRLKSDVVLLVAGEAWWNAEEEYRRLAKGLTNVRFDFRFIPDAEIATWFAATDVVIAPYRTEAQSGVALTAFHFQRPVIATRVGGIPEIVQDGVNGYLIPPENAEALASAVERFFAEADRKAMEAACEATARKHSWEDYARVFASLIA
jgi:glycosyltransferase involved in cell wall biosynthesis